MSHWPRLPDPEVDVEVFPSHSDDRLFVWNVGIIVVWVVVLSEMIGVMAPDHRAAGRKDNTTSVVRGTHRNHGKENDTLGIDAAWTNWSVLSENFREASDAVKEILITVPAIEASVNIDFAGLLMIRRSWGRGA